MSADATVLYDAPGPKARTRNLVIAVIGGVVLAGALVVVIRALAGKDQLTPDKWLPFLETDSWTAYLIPGLVGTLVAAAISVVLAVIVGIALGMGRLSDLAAIRVLCGAFVEFFRAVPVLVMMLFAYFFGIFVLQVDPDALPLFGTVVGLTFYNSCVIAELVRSGVHALPGGQREAGLALGLTPTQTLISVLLPQAITAMLPSIISQLVVILKDSALGYNIVFLELLRQGQNLATYRGNLIPTLIVLAAIYIVINYALSKLAGLVERRMRAGKRGIKAVPDAGFVVMEETAADEGVVAPADR